MTNLEKYKADIEKLVIEGNMLLLALSYGNIPDEDKKQLKKAKDENQKIIDKIPSFDDEYQTWYSEALVLLKQILPDRVDDFKRLFEKPKTMRKYINSQNCVIEDVLQEYGNSSAAIPLLQQQIAIIKSCEKRFESSLFDIQQLLQADLFDSEIDIAGELNKKGFVRGAGAIAGVVLEGHLAQICKKHNLKIGTKNPMINYFNDLLKNENIIGIPVFRHIQLLGDLRNKCDHNKSEEPTKEEIKKLIEGVNEIIKTVF